MAKTVLDLHGIYNRGTAIEAELNRVISEATQKKIKLVKIIPGKDSSQHKKYILRFLSRPGIKEPYHRLKKDDKDFG